MASTIILRRRISSIRNTRQITKAMELVAASKMRKAQDQALRSRAYRDAAYGLLRRLNSISEVTRQPLFRQREIQRRLYVVVTSNSGLAGAYNANVLKLLTSSIREDRVSGIRSQVIAIGNKGAQFCRRLKDIELLAVYPAFGDHPTPNDLRPTLNTIIEKYIKEETDEVILLYTLFKSNLAQLATRTAIMPASFDEAGKSDDAAGGFTNFEPDVETVLLYSAITLIEAQLWQAVLEAIASEHSARMLAMKNASDNASDLIEEYTLEFNTARQAAITQELAEISGGVEAMNE
ncbi:ATP synthase F1 subunit gamma [Patescibacteria group bacterium]|nr:ATP synthase F1 subunit gamma [Patescibacteria group bacterium]